MSDIPERALDIFPPAYAIMMLISGAIFLFFSPLQLLLPKSIINPFSNSTPTDILAVFAILAICSFIIGIFFFILESHITGNGGLNNQIRFVLESIKNLLLRKEQPRPTSKDVDPQIADLKRFVWIQKEGYSGYHDFFVIQDSIIKAVLLGFEGAFVINSLVLGSIICLHYSLMINLQFAFLGLVVIKLLILEILSGALFIFALLYEKKVWRKRYNSIVKPIFDAYENKKIGLDEVKCSNP